MTAIRRPASAAETVVCCLLLGLAGGALTFAHYQQAVYPGALPTPRQLPVALLFLSGVLLAALHFDLPSTVRIAVPAVVLSYLTLVSLQFAPQLLGGWSAAQLFVLYTFSAGGDTIGKWLLFEPLPFVAGIAAVILVEDGPFS